MNGTCCHCVFPSPTEEVLVTVPGPDENTAFRLHLEANSPDGYVRLEQMAYNQGLGWYVQKSFVLPASALRAMLPQLKLADCLIPRPKHADCGPLRLFPSQGAARTQAG